MQAKYEQEKVKRDAKRRKTTAMAEDPDPVVASRNHLIAVVQATGNNSPSSELAAAFAFLLLRHSELRELVAQMHMGKATGCQKAFFFLDFLPDPFKTLPELEAELEEVAKHGNRVYTLLAAKTDAVSRDFVKKMMTESYKFHPIAPKYQTMEQVFCCIS